MIDSTKQKIQRGFGIAGEKASTEGRKVEDGVKTAVRGAKETASRNCLDGGKRLPESRDIPKNVSDENSSLSDENQFPRHQSNQELTASQVDLLINSIQTKLPAELVKIIEEHAAAAAEKVEAKQIDNQKDFARLFFSQMRRPLHQMMDEDTTRIFILQSAPYFKRILADVQDFTSKKPLTPKLQADLDALKTAIDDGDNDGFNFRLLEVLRTMYLINECLPDDYPLEDRYVHLAGTPEAMLIRHERERKTVNTEG